mgnify:CR=1 FL=1
MDKALQALMLKLLTQYIEMSVYAAQKQILTSRNPQPWMVDKAFQGLFNSVPQYHAMSTMQPANSGTPGFDINQLLQMVTNNAPQQPQPPAKP